ncbi:hypothetical protein ACTA71_007325 [Dictyostelium dimigraforme]
MKIFIFYLKQGSSSNNSSNPSGSSSLFIELLIKTNKTDKKLNQSLDEEVQFTDKQLSEPNNSLTTNDILFLILNYLQLQHPILLLVVQIFVINRDNNYSNNQF